MGYSPQPESVFHITSSSPATAILRRHRQIVNRDRSSAGIGFLPSWTSVRQYLRQRALPGLTTKPANYADNFTFHVATFCRLIPYAHRAADDRATAPSISTSTPCESIFQQCTFLCNRHATYTNMSWHDAAAELIRPPAGIHCTHYAESYILMMRCGTCHDIPQPFYIKMPASHIYIYIWQKSSGKVMHNCH